MGVQLIVAFGLGLLLIYLLAKFFMLPLRILSKLLMNGIIGGVTLVVINFFGAYIGFAFPINIFTVLITGFLGLPGIVLLLILQKLF